MLRTVFDPRRWPHIPRRLRERRLLRDHGVTMSLQEVNGALFNVIDDYAKRFPIRFDWPVASYLQAHVRSTDTCFNIGANLGIYTLQFATWAAEGFVHAFEPAPQAARILRAHVGLNHFESRVRIVQKAVSDQVGNADFYAEDTSVMNRLGVPNGNLKAARKINVQVTTIDEYCQEHNLVPDWIHIDVEGFEPCVLRGARKTFTSNPDLKFVVDMHPGEWHLTNTDSEGFERLVHDLGLQARCLMGDDGPFGWGTTLMERR